MSSNSSTICRKIKWFKWHLYVHNQNVSCVDVPKPFEIQITFGSNTHPSVSEDTLGFSLFLMSPGWGLASSNIIAPLLSVFLSFPHLILSPEIAQSLLPEAHSLILYMDNIIKGREPWRRWCSKTEWPKLNFNICELKNPWSGPSCGEITLYLLHLGCGLLVLCWVSLSWGSPLAYTTLLCTFRKKAFFL